MLTTSGYWSRNTTDYKMCNFHQAEPVQAEDEAHLDSSLDHRNEPGWDATGEA
jgi:hypothetical protein